ncbi:hypothetical protein, partial [Actinomadura sp. HBU206391]|uniref:hypothetical protein n=1 Tax=Actinomadura sp. HBU206391 TaxID=2731692 RepID=UPI001C9D0849
AFKDGWSGIGSLFTTNPIDTLKSMWDDSTKDIRQDWNNDHHGAAAGRAVPTILGMIGGVGWFGRGTKLLKSLRIPGLPVKARRAAETAADQAADAADRGDPKAARAAADTADEHARTAQDAAAADPTAENKEAAAKARQAADGAKSVVRVAEVRAVLRKSALGREVIKILDRYKVTVVVGEGGGTQFWHGPNKVHLDTKELDSPGWLAINLAHETLHALRWNTGTTVVAKVRAMGRGEWVNAMLQEEAMATSWQLETALELRRQGVYVPKHPLEDVYWPAVRYAEEQGKDGMAAGTRALFLAHRAGMVTTSSRRETYPDAFGRQWDEKNNPPAKRPGK